MRRVERGPAPAFVQTPEFQALRREYEAFRSTGGSRVTQTKLDPRSSLGAIESSFSRASRAGTVRSVNRLGSRPAFSSAQRRGVGTVAPGTGRST